MILFGMPQTIKADIQRYRILVEGGLESKSPQKNMLLVALSPRFAPVFIYRISYWLYQNGFATLAKFVSMVNYVVFGIEVSLRCSIGPGLILPHTQGTVIGARSIGANATIYQGVTIGAKDLDLENTPERRPEIGDNVTIGAGAKIIGNVVIGNGARIGANCVVVGCVPPNSLAVGVPARIARSCVGK